jgi:hypothetical protein
MHPLQPIVHQNSLKSLASRVKITRSSILPILARPASSTASQSSLSSPNDQVSLLIPSQLNKANYLHLKSSTKPASEAPPAKKKKTQAELDKELELKMQGLAGDGGASGVEYEDGQPVAMKRSVKNNMFRYI